MRLAGKRILLVGCSSGIGRALALRLAGRGAHLGLFARRRGLLESLAAEIGGRGGEARVLVGDTTRDEDVAEAWGAFTADAPADGVVFVAGISAVSTPVTPSVADARAVMEANYLGFVRWAAHAVPALRERGEGLLAATTALCADRGIPLGEEYAASKAALASYLECLALDLEPVGVRVHQLVPGFVRSPMSDLNNFTQPFMIEPEHAAEIVVRGLEAERFRIEFGPGMSRLMRLLRALPEPLYRRVFRGFTHRRQAVEDLLGRLPSFLCPTHEEPLAFDRYGAIVCPECDFCVRFVRDHLDWIDGTVSEPDAEAESDEGRLRAAYRLYSLTYPVTSYLAMKLVWKGSLRHLLRFYRGRLRDAATTGEPCLEVATGDGSLLALALRGVAEPPAFLAVDLSRDMLAGASRRLSGHPAKLLYLRDAARLNLPDESFSRILCFGGVHVFPDPAAVLARLGALLREDGALSGSILTRPPTEAGRRWSARFVAWGTLSNSMTEEELDALFARAGLRFEHREWNGAMLLFVARRAGGESGRR